MGRLVIKSIILYLSIVVTILIPFKNLQSDTNKSNYQKQTKNQEESLTNKYINSLREGKWGASEPSWVKIKQAKEFFPNATKLGRLEGDPPAVSVLNKGELIGYLFVTKDITSSKVGSAPFNGNQTESLFVIILVLKRSLSSAKSCLPSSLSVLLKFMYLESKILVLLTFPLASS